MVIVCKMAVLPRMWLVLFIQMGWQAKMSKEKNNFVVTMDLKMKQGSAVTDTRGHIQNPFFHDRQKP
jgi:hypothetical protein